MSTTPPRCHFDRGLGYRTTHAHLDDCSDPQHCDGCEPCTEGHCSVCNRRHLDDAHPRTCVECISSIREDFAEITTLCTKLRTQAVHASNDGHLWASAPIPGANAMVLVGPAVQPTFVRRGRHYTSDHRVSDPMPPLAILATWEDKWRAWLNQPQEARATIHGAIAYLDGHLTMLAQTGMKLDGDKVRTPPEFPEFAVAIGRLRVQLEHTLHDEEQPDHGVDCFECGAQLVRRHRDPFRCRHATPAREWFATVLSYPEFGLPWPTEVAAARLPCPRCDQGGIRDPRPGISWECPSCRMKYTPGQYATAVRRDLLDSDEGDGWTDIGLAADAASTLTGRQIPATTVRKWMDRGLVSSMCLWTHGQTWGQRVVYWPDVADRATSSGPARRAS